MHPDLKILKFLDVVESDLSAGGLRSLDEYLGRFPDCAELVRLEYEALCQPPRATERERAEETSAANSRVVGGRYRLLESLGRGGFGEVFLAEDTVVHRRVAIKLLRGLRALSQEWRTRLTREAVVASRIHDAGLCTVHDVGFDEGIPFLVMAWVAGRSLDRWLADSVADGTSPVALVAAERPLADRRQAVLALIESVARTLAAVHAEGVVHRDVKPANIIVRPDGRPVLIDFGLAWLEESSEGMTRSGGLGTPAYIAPEVLTGTAGAPDPRLDVWSLGVVLFEALTLRRPFVPRAGQVMSEAIHGGGPPRLDRSHSRDLQAVVETALALRPEQRYASMQAFAEDLARVRQGIPVQARAAGLVRRSLSWLARRPRLVGLVVAALALGSSLLVLGVNRWKQREERAVVALATSSLARLVDELAEGESLRSEKALADRSSVIEQLLATVRELRAGVGEDPEIERALATTLVALGRLDLRRGRPEIATRGLQEAEGLLQRLIAISAPMDEDLARLALAIVLLGDARSHRGDAAGALERYRTALDLDAKLLERDPNSATRRSNVGFGHLRIGHMLAFLGRREEGLVEQLRAVEHLLAAEAADPQNPRRMDHVADAMIETSWTMTLLGEDPERAMALVDDAERRLLQRPAAERTDADWQRLGRIQVRRRDLAGTPEKRFEYALLGVSSARRASELQPDDPFLLAALSLVASAAAHEAAQLSSGDMRERALELGETALRSAERALQSTPELWLPQLAYVGALLSVAEVRRCFLDANREAEQLVRKALLYAEDLHARSPRSSHSVFVLVTILLHPTAGELADPERARRLLAEHRAAGGEMTTRLLDLERRALATGRAREGPR